VAELNTVLGAILRDVAQSRVVADLFSRNVSVEYQQDPILKDFPVPRVEIVQATLDLKFAVTEVADAEVDRAAVIGGQFAPFAASLAGAVFANLIASNPRRAELEDVIQRKHLALTERLPALIGQAATANLDDVNAALEGRPDALVRRLNDAVGPVVLDEPDLREVLTGGEKLADIRERVSATASTIVQRLTAEGRPGREPGARRTLPRARLGQLASTLGQGVFERVVVASPRRAEVEVVLADKGLRLDRQLADRAAQTLLAEPDLVGDALEGRPDALVSKLENDLFEAALADEAVKDALTRRVPIGTLREQLSNTIAAALPNFVKGVRDALAAAERQAHTINVAVTTGELADTPESKISQISVVSQVRNYEWVDVGAAEGVSRPRLQPE
jgi:hypothetical protein